MRSCRWERVIDHFRELQEVRQGYILSPYFYNIMAAFLIRLRFTRGFQRQDHNPRTTCEHEPNDGTLMTE